MPGRPRSTVAHAAILRASIDLIREVGYDAVTMEGIAARARVGKATVYRRWRSKETLVAEALQQIMRAVPVPDTGSVRDDLQLVMGSALRMYQDPATLALLSGLVAAMARSAMIATAMRSGFVATWRNAVRALLERGRARGEVRRDADIELAIDMLSAPMLYRFLITGVAIDDALVRDVVALVIRALAPNEPSDSRGV
jgi:AcrR family transcriptional regulator